VPSRPRDRGVGELSEAQTDAAQGIDPIAENHIRSWLACMVADEARSANITRTARRCGSPSADPTSRHVLAEIEAAGLPRLQTSLREAVAR